MDLELVATVGAIGDENGVIEVAGGFAVNCDDGQAAEIGGPAGNSLLVEMGD